MRSDLHRLFDGGYLTIDPVDEPWSSATAFGRNSKTAKTTIAYKASESANPATWPLGR